MAGPSSASSDAGARSDRRLRVAELDYGEDGYGVPALPSGTVRRVERLPKLTDTRNRVVVLSAPAGYGKTTLIAEWAASDQRPFACVTVKEPETSAACLVRSLVRALAALGAIDHRLLLASKEDEDDTLLARLALSDSRSEPFVIVLDDAHLLSGRDNEAVVHALIDQLPPDSQLVLAGHGCSQFHLGRLGANHDVVELDAAALALHEDEIEALLRGCGVVFQREAVSSLVERTEGWPAAVYLAAISLQEAHDPAARAVEFSGNDRYVADYTRDELLRGLADDVLDFLVQTSVLERLSGPLCDVVLDRTGSAQLLEDLYESNQVVLPLDHHHEWYRYHPLLRDLLIADLGNRGPEIHDALHLRVSVWCETVSDHDGAVRHAIMGSDPQRARELIWTNLPGLVAENRGEVADGWLELLGRSALVNDPTLALAVAVSRLASGNPEQVAWWIAVAEEADRGDDEDVSGGERREAMLALISTFTANDGLDGMRRDAGRACRLIATSSPLHFLACAYEVIGSCLAGEPSARFEWETLLRVSETRAPQPEAGGESVFALAALDAGNWAEAEAWIGRARSIIRDTPGLEERPGQAMTFAVSALFHAHGRARSDATDDWERARTLLTRVPGFAPWVQILARCALARTSILLGDPATARVLNDEAAALMDAMPGWEALRPRVLSIRDSLDHASLAGATSLTAAELRLLRHLPTHLSLGQIAGQLYVTRNTVKTQTVALYRKLDATSRGEAVDHTRELGLIESESD